MQRPHMRFMSGPPMFLHNGMLPSFMASAAPRYPPPAGQFGDPVDQTYYQCLKLPVTSQEAAIRRAYRDLSRTQHPDKGGNATSYQQLNEAHNVLSDPEKRACYDAYGLEFEKVPNLALFIQDLRPDPVEVTLPLSTADCIKGEQAIVHYRRYMPGSSQLHKATSTVHVPPNVPNGHRVVLPGQGHVQPPKTLPGHLVVVVVEQPVDRQCQRVGGSNGLVLFHHKITLAQALSGRPVALPLPDGTVTRVTRSVLHPNQCYQIEGTPVTTYVLFEIAFPAELTTAQHQGLRAVFGGSVDAAEEDEEAAAAEASTGATSALVAISRDELEQQAQQARQRVQEDVLEQQPPSLHGPGGPECRTQ